jgi:uncharacterized protein YndB with AHSA1/START domain
MRTPYLAILCLAASPIMVHAQQPAGTLPPIEMSAIVPAMPDKVWAALTTAEGVKKWEVSQAEYDTRIGGIWKTKYGKEGNLDDDGAIHNELLAYDPGHMFAIRIHKAPKGFPFPNVYRNMWTVVYFEPVAGGKTKVTLRGLGFKDDAESKKMRTFFEGGDKYTLDILVKYFEKQAKAPGKARNGVAQRDMGRNSGGKNLARVAKHSIE